MGMNVSSSVVLAEYSVAGVAGKSRAGLAGLGTVRFASLAKAMESDP